MNDPVPFPEKLPVKRVSVNSFGYGGTNAHAIIEEADPFLQMNRTYTDSYSRKEGIPQEVFDSERPFLLLFSAHDKATLMNNIAAHGGIVNKYSLLDLSYTLANRRTYLQSRAFVVGGHASLDSCFSNAADAFTFGEKRKASKIGFVFTGQGAQWAGMGVELLANYPSFLRSIRVLDAVLKDLVDRPEWTLEQALLEPSEASRVNEAEFSQPLVTAIQVAIIQLLELWGVRPTVTVGHSSGEIGAAFAAGLISATQAIIIAYYRGKVVCEIDDNGAMIAVGLGAEMIQPYLEDMGSKVTVACHNSPTSVTLSGDADAIAVVKARLIMNNIFVRFVRTGGKAYHSHHMKPIAVKYSALIRQSISKLPFDPPQSSDITMISSVTGSKIGPGTIIDRQYWSVNLCSPVLFNQAIQTIAMDSQFANVDLLIEIGPHPALSGPIHQICGSLGYDRLGYLPTLSRGTDSASQLLRLAGELFLRDYPLDIERITRVEESTPSGKICSVNGSVIVDLPRYQWNYAKDFWAEPRRSREHRNPLHARHDILGQRIPGGSITEPVWRNMLRIRDVPWLQHHSLGGEAIFPAAGYFSMAIEAVTQLNEDSPSPVKLDGYVLRNISFKAALVTPDNDTGIEVMCSIRHSVYNESDNDHEWWDFNISSISDTGHGTDHMAGSIAVNARQRGEQRKKPPKFPQRASGKAWNQALREVGFDYGPTFQDMTDIRFDGSSHSATCKTAIKSTCGIMEGESRHVLHPSTVDSCLQLIMVSIYAGRLENMSSGVVPAQVDEVAVWIPTAEQLNNSADVFSWTNQRGIRWFSTGSQLTASDGELLLDISNMRATTYEAAIPQKANDSISSQPYGEMVWVYDIDSLTSSSNIVNMDLDQLVELAVYKNPALKIIEIGSKHAATILPRWELLDYTTIVVSEKAVEEAGLKLEKWKNARVLKLDISHRLDSQTAAESLFDLIIVPAGKLNSVMLENIRHLLKPNARAVFETSEDLSMNLLRSADFSEIDFKVQDRGGSTLTMCTAVQPSTDRDVNGVHHEVLLVYRKQPTTMLSDLKVAFERLGWQATATSLEDHQCKSGEHVVMLADFEGALLATLEEKELAAVQSITSAASMLLWVSCGGLLTGKIPEYAMNIGLARSIASEQNSLDFMVLDFDFENTSTESVVDIITTMTRRQSLKSESDDSEYYVSEGIVHISRLVPNRTINRLYGFDKEHTIPTPFETCMSLFGKVQSGKVVFQVDTSKEEDLDPDYVEVKVLVAGLNKEDVLVVDGFDYPTTFSHEIGGIVQRVGKSVIGLVVGDHVFGFSFSNFATIQRMPADLVHRVEDGEVLQELTTLPMAYGTALYGLKNLAKLEAGEKVLILNGTGSAGLAAIKVAELYECIPYVAVETEAEASVIMTHFGLDKRQILMSSELSLINQLKALTGGSGPDVVFSSGTVNAGVVRECWRSLERFGRFVDSGRKNFLKRSVLDTVPLHRGASYLSFDILDLYSWKPRALGDVLRLTAFLYRQRSIMSLRPVNVQSLGELEFAIAAFSDQFTAGKTLISYEPCDTPLNILQSRPSTTLRADATYLLVGCLGGLGRSLTTWMMKNGARRFAFLSRSGTDSAQAATLVKDIESTGVVVQVIRGDVTIVADIESAVKSIPTDYPIRGVIQAAMVLKVRITVLDSGV